MLPQPAQDTVPGQEFSPQAIVQLIQAVGRRWEQYSTRERGRLFQGVQEELAQNGQAFPLERIRRKWNNLLVTYKRVHERARYTGQHKTTWEYYEMMDALLSSSSKSTATTTSMATTSNIALSLAASLLSLPSLLPTLPSSPLSPPPPPPPSSSINPDPPNPAPQPPASALTSPPPQEGPSSLPRPRRLAPRLRVNRKLKQPAVDSAAAFLAQQHSQVEERTGLLQSFLAAQEERGRAEEEWRRREEERERRRELRERRALGTLGRLVTTLELLSSKQDTAIALLQRLADQH
ncbi:espin-like [Amia ocellicauda]|uniref:espin-like n=1 Tax=Amia ocellicauda TaxID=2972642 RepID=UPI00346401A7